MAKFFCLFFYDAPLDSFNVFIRQRMVHGQTDDFVGHLCGNGKVLLGGAGQAAVGAEIAYQRIEIAAPKDALLLHLEIEIVAGHAILGGIDEDGEVAVVMENAGQVVP